MRVSLSHAGRGAAPASRALGLACRAALLAAAAACLPPPGARAQSSNQPRPFRHYSVVGRVSLPDDRPATRVRVKLSNGSDITREAFTNDNGGFEFSDLPPGAYFVSATSLADPSLASEPVEANTRRTANSVVRVSIFLRAAGAGRRQEATPAVISLAEAGQKVPKEARKAFRQGLALKDERRWDEALPHITRAVELYPDYFQALAERGDIYVRQRKLAEAAEDFARALRLNPRHAPALRGAGYCKLEGREFGEAARYLEQAAALDPGNAGTLLLVGIARLELDERDAARRALQQALKLDPLRAVRAHIYLANLLAREREYTKAADELRLYLEAVPDDPEAAELRRVEASWRARPEDR